VKGSLWRRIPETFNCVFSLFRLKARGDQLSLLDKINSPLYETKTPTLLASPSVALAFL